MALRIVARVLVAMIVIGRAALFFEKKPPLAASRPHAHHSYVCGCTAILSKLLADVTRARPGSKA
jgi:hypothetical protein